MPVHGIRSVVRMELPPREERPEAGQETKVLERRAASRRARARADRKELRENEREDGTGCHSSAFLLGIGCMGRLTRIAERARVEAP